MDSRRLGRLRRLRTTRTAASVLSATALALTLTACGSAGPGAGTGSATMWGLNGGDQDVLKHSVDTWNKAHPDEDISLDFFANDAYKTKVRTAVGAGKGPTFIYGWGGGVLKSYVDAGQAADLSPYLARNPEVRDRYLPSVLDNGVVGGKTYAIPNGRAQPILLYFNRDVFARAGAEPPRTWSQLMALVPKFKKMGIAPFALGGQSKWPDLMWLEYLVDRIGGPRVFADIVANKPGAWSHPAVTEALTKIQQLVDAGGFADSFTSSAADNGADLALVHTGKAAMVVQGGWLYQNMKSALPEAIENRTIGWTTFPTVEGGKGSPANLVGNPSNYWSLSSKATASQRKAALGYLKNGMFSEAHTQELIDSGAVPVVKGIKKRLEASQDKDFLTFVYELTQRTRNFTLSWDQALSPAQADALLVNLDQIFLKKIDPHQFTARMNATIEE
ncbi:extracellular solute-binding protein [Streptomyces endophyticus]|uniref:Extracellular solute-binding protein n=1 Tax=Streptomyces endophyticus TaxID=714166 RepID=A0ABU6F9N8_9ACTN|nr:extracellular solute-binding protein [Streptomyces endophyticus]MEB8340746.1 extracellular solute-binding protein [Streptomyces endophyticus]